MRKKGSLGGLSMEAAKEEKQGSTAMTHRSGHQGGDGSDKMDLHGAGNARHDKARLPRQAHGRARYSRGRDVQRSMAT
jgi:hypothetical protein